MENKRFKYIDFIRVLSCIAVLLYHIGILKGGYLAVCMFFVMSGYLSITSNLKKEKFSLGKYYLNRLIKLYIPLLLTVFISVVVMTSFTNFNWINLKPEVTSILLGYNNYWQLNANLDYFVRNVSSPFMHLWYISILLQIELILPLIILLFRKIKGKTLNIISLILLFIIGSISYYLFFNNINSGNIMNAYYGTLERSFSIIFGLLLGLIHINNKPLVIKNNIISKIVFYIYLLILITMFIVIDSSSPLFNYSMIISTFIGMRLISYAVYINSNYNLFDKTISFLSSISYEIYLVQYPVIFIFMDLEINNIIKILMIILITIIVSCLLHFVLDYKKKNKTRIIKIILLVLLSFVSIFGVYKYIIAKDYTNDIKKLEEDLNNNRMLIEEKQKEYLEKQEEEEQSWEEFLSSSEVSEEELKEKVRKLKIVGIGDSIMELAVKDLYKEFPNGYFDAAVNRTEHAVVDILKDLDSKGALGDVLLFNLGTNGECSAKCRANMMDYIGDRTIFWVNATHPDFASFNPNLIEFAKKYPNIHIIDWISVANEHPEYLIHDKVHPTVTGCKVYAKTIYDQIYDYYLKEYNDARDKKIKEHTDYENNKITFIGNDLLSGIYDSLGNYYTNKKFIINNSTNYDSLIESINKDNLSNNIVLVFDNTLILTKEEYNSLIEYLGNRKIYIVGNDNIDNVTMINFNYDDYLTFDKIHLTEEGSSKLFDSIKEVIPNEEK